MELKEQRYVCTLAEYGNLTRAADRLYISQPALSIYISNLENIWGPLFSTGKAKNSN
ncbi:helix-turn-helix domain-containing protein [Acidaminococcus fermentans]|uniref:helix-turn-helix domain-containing protein n=1 Tax=Acidaminococcus fermentans TaxID=905 RepID=UPI00266B6493|nr:LysR family transcriptional regulator [Acidaminococcus fermentans]